MIYMVLGLVFILGQAFFSGIEIGLVSLPKPRVQHGVRQKIRRAFILDFFIKHPGYLLSTTLIGTNICVVCSSNMAKKTAASFGFESAEAMLTTTIVMTGILIMAEIIPKDWFRQQPYWRCLFFSYILYAAFIVLYIPVYIMSKFTGMITCLAGPSNKDDQNTRTLMREDFRILLRESENAGIIENEVADILDRSLDFHSLRVADIYQYGKQIKEISSSYTVAEAVDYCIRSRKSRVPVKISSQKDESQKSSWGGIFSIYDAIFNIPEKEWKNIKVSDYLRPITLISADTRLNDVLIKSKLAGTPILVVTDPSDQSKHIGIVTPIDVVMNLFG